MDTENALLAAISKELEKDYGTQSGEIWVGSPYQWIRQRSSRQRGAIGEKLVSGWFAAKGANVVRSSDSDADRVIEGLRCEIKLSTLWESGIYKFQQIRDQDYEHLICLGLSPFEAHCWILPKTVLSSHVIGVMGQHTGSAGRDTAWLSFDPGKPFAWMEEFGGSLRDAWAQLVTLRPELGLLQQD